MRKKKVKWRWDMGCYLPFCPYCGEPVYEEYDTEKCYFCGQPFKFVKGLHKPRSVTVGKYTITQTTGKSIYARNNETGEIEMHASCTKRKSKRQLKKMVEGYERLIAERSNNE